MRGGKVANNKLNLLCVGWSLGGGGVLLQITSKTFRDVNFPNFFEFNNKIKR